MAKAKQEKVTPTEETPGVEPQIVEPPVEEKLYGQLEVDALVAKVAQERDAAQRAVSEKAEQIRRKDEELKKQTDVAQELADLRETQQIQAAMLAEFGSRGTEDIGEVPDKKIYLQRYDDLVKQQAERRKQEQLKRQQEEYNTKAEAIYQKAIETFGDDNDAALGRIERMLGRADFAGAEARIAKAAAPTKEGSEEERFTKKLEEEKRKWAEEHGLLTTDIGGPGGATQTFAAKEKAYAEGKITYAEYAAARKEAKID